MGKAPEFDVASGPTQVGPKSESTGTSDDLPIGTAIADYVIVGMLGIGGCGVVYRADHRLLGRHAALKVLHQELAQSAEMVERFVREARAANVIRHPNIVDIWDIGKLEDGRPYYIMELLEGLNLEQLLVKNGSFAPTEALELLEPVCAALQAAHDAGIVHRDLKASNIVVVHQGAQRIVKLLDFGIAKLLHPDPAATGLTSVGRQLGTPTSMAPEQIRGATIDRRTDLYALGVLLYHMLTCRFPFESRDAIEVERMHLDLPAPRPSDRAAVTPQIDAVVLRCLEKLPERRYQTATAFLDALREAVGGGRRRPSSASQSPRAAQAVAILVETRFREDAEADMDDSLLDAMAELLEAGAHRLREAGLLVPLQAGNAVLGVVPLPAEGADEAGERRRVLELAATLRVEFDRMTGQDPRMHVNVAVHVDKALVRSSAQGGEEIIGGRIVNVALWMPQENLNGVCVTAPAMEGLSLTGEARGNYFIVG
jgi:serine/threonine-protein kinase